MTEVSVHLSEVEMTTNMALDVRSGHTKALLTSVHLAVERVTNSALPLIISGHTHPNLCSALTDSRHLTLGHLVILHCHCTVSVEPSVIT